jgi:hypothetical protein
VPVLYRGSSVVVGPSNSMSLSAVVIVVEVKAVQSFVRFTAQVIFI